MDWKVCGVFTELWHSQRCDLVTVKGEGVGVFYSPDTHSNFPLEHHLLPFVVEVGDQPDVVVCREESSW